MFQDLTFKDYDHLIDYFSSQRYRLCYYSLSSLIAWENRFSKPVWKIEDDGLISGKVFYTQPDKNYLILPVAKGREFSPAQLYKLAKENAFNKYQYVPEDYISGHNYSDINHLFTIIEQIGYEDYIYRTEDLAELKGKKYAKKRNLISQFSKNILSVEDVTIEKMGADDTDECLGFLRQTWAESKKYDVAENEDAICEMAASENALIHIEHLGLQGLVLRINGKIKAFGIGSELTPEIGGFHFQKADPSVKGLYQYFDRECARRLFDAYPYINKECDMGDPGLRQAKRSYYPVDTVKSYQLILK